jgi:hypothetical protein
VAAVVLLAGCGSGGGTPDRARNGRPAAPSVPARATGGVTAGATTEPPAASTPGIGPDGTSQTGAAATGAAGRQPTVPRAQLTPATGTFTERERDYLVGKVPEGMDPAAVLQAGQESCERIATAAGAGTASARQAVRDGEIPDARDAITYLCPRYRNLLG